MPLVRAEMWVQAAGLSNSPVQSVAARGWSIRARASSRSAPCECTSVGAIRMSGAAAARYGAACSVIGLAAANLILSSPLQRNDLAALGRRGRAERRPHRVRIQTKRKGPETHRQINLGKYLVSTWAPKDS